MKRKKNWDWYSCILIAATSICNCTYDEEIYVSKEFSVEEQSLIQDAASEWSKSTAGAANIDLIFDNYSENHSKTIRKVSAEYMNEHKIPITGATLGLHEKYTHTETIYLIVERIQSQPMYEDIPYTFKTTILHEFGHHFGMPHSLNEDSIMFSKGNSWGCITKRDVENYCAINKNCDDMAKMSWCVDPIY